LVCTPEDRTGSGEGGDAEVNRAGGHRGMSPAGQGVMASVGCFVQQSHLQGVLTNYKGIPAKSKNLSGRVFLKPA
ncbi:MAG: hypothetical protein L6Q74_20865, partial [Sphaerotilus natans subsp. sulfidivorans]|uniref:hypothetical protein n=1 Tax=Sphaerotilus sulfidivorans TaxID=639200 RepID=UPI00235274CD